MRVLGKLSDVCVCEDLVCIVMCVRDDLESRVMCVYVRGPGKSCDICLYVRTW